MSKYQTFENEADENLSPVTEPPEHLETDMSPIPDSESATISPQITSLKTVGHSTFLKNASMKNNDSHTVIISDPADLEMDDSDVG